MANHSSARVREHTPHANQTSRTNTIVNALKRRIQAVLNDKSLDPQSRAIIRYALEINDPWLAELVRRADAGEAIVDTNLEETPETYNDDSNEEKIEALTEFEKAIYLIRGEKVMLDRDLAELYEVQTKALNQAVRRNPDRFPADFMFQLSEKEVVELNRSQFVTGSQKHRDPRSRPYAFTEQGVAMLSSVLRSKRAITVNIEIMRAFVKLPTIARVQHRTRSPAGRT